MLGIGADRNLPRVLLIDEDMISREVIATLLTLNGYTLHTASETAGGLEMLRTGVCSPQVILVNVQAAGLSGAELIRELRALSRAALYAMGVGKPEKELRDAADAYLEKPVTGETLQKLLGTHGKQLSPLASRIAAEPVINQEILAQFRQVMREQTVREVYAAVVADLHKRIPALEEAIARKDRVQVRQIGHSIKGGCGMAGARQAARVGAMLEGESDELSNSAALLGELHGALERLERTLEVAFSGQAT
ncbi:MAG TPA: Hpt domain-containing protein [Terracidiphilus sp.]|nr:Hpt domain-containing protein [Terracidiphilus sp.]